MSDLDRYTLTLPTADNDGADVSLAHDHAQGALEALAGGWSAVRMHGAWIDGGRRYEDDSVRYEILVTPSAEIGHALVKLARELCALARQESVLVTGPEHVPVGFIRP